MIWAVSGFLGEPVVLPQQSNRLRPVAQRHAQVAESMAPAASAPTGNLIL